MLPGIGIFGTGSRVKIVVSILKLNGFKVKAIWGQSLAGAELMSKEHDIPYFTNQIDRLLLQKDVDLVFIMCPPNIQSQIAIKALSIGKHVFCDTPGGLCPSEALKMVQASQYYPSLIAVVNHSLRYLPAFQNMKLYVLNGFLDCKSTDGNVKICDVRVQTGPLHLNKFNWLCDKTMGGGILTLIGSHVIDLISHMLSQKAVKVHGVIKTLCQTTSEINGIRHITSPDFCTFQMEMNEGALVTVTLNSHLPTTYTQEVLICNKESYLVVRGGDLYGFKNGDAKESIMYEDAQDAFNKNELFRKNENMPRLYIKGLFAMLGLLKESFYSVGEDGGWVKDPIRNATTFEDSLYTHAVIDAIEKSNATKEWVNVKVVEDTKRKVSTANRKF